MHKRILVALIVLAIGSNFYLPARADSDYDAGVASYRDGKYKEAFDLLLRSLDRNPNNADAYYVMALTCQQMGKFVEARSYYQFIVDHFPKSKAFPMATKGVQQLAHVKAPVATTASTAKSTGPKVVVHGRTEIEKSVADVIPDEERIPYSRLKNDKLYVQGLVNGRPIRMLIDTGAYKVVFGKNHLRELGIKPPEGKATGMSGGAAGHFETWETTLDISLGKIKVHLPVEVIEQEETPLLGQPFLSKMHYEIDNSTNYIRFLNKNRKTKADVPRNTIDIPYRMVDGNLIVEAEVNGIPCEMNFDTGAGECVFSIAEARYYRLTRVSEVEFIWMGGVGGGSVPALYFQVPSIELGEISKRHVQVIVSQQGGGHYPVLGQSFFRGSRYVIDSENKVIRFYR